MRLFTMISALTALCLTLNAGAQTTTAALPKPLTIAEWSKLSNADKEALIDGVDVELYTNLRLIEFSEKSAINKVEDPAAKAYAEKMDAFMQDHVNFEIEDEHSRVGDATVYFLNILILDGTPVGGSIGYFQKGCDLEEDNYQSFASEDEARAAGCDVDADVSWQANGTFDENAQPISYSEYMEWSGY